MSRFKQILVPIDFSPHSTAAFRGCRRDRKNVRLEIDSAPLLPDSTRVASHPTGIAIPSSYFSDIRDAASQQLADWQEKHVPAGIQVNASTMSEAPSESILIAAKETGADLIVMGTRGLSGFKHVMLGSVAERTVRLASCPVMTVHAPESESADGD